MVGYVKTGANLAPVFYKRQLCQNAFICLSNQNSA